MYQKAGEAMVPELIRYFERDLKNCLYSYIDLMKYGIRNPNLTVYYSKGQNIKSIAASYYEGLQIFSLEELFPMEETLELVARVKPAIISAADRVIRMLKGPLSGVYGAESGYVAQMNHLDDLKIPVSELPEPGNFSDLQEIAELICSDEGLGGHYRPEDLRGQLETRMKESFGRSYIIRFKGEIVCHAATYAEVEKLAVISGVITRGDYRGRGLAADVVGRLCCDLMKEGKKPYLFYYTEGAGALYRKIGFENGTRWAKLVRKTGSF